MKEERITKKYLLGQVEVFRTYLYERESAQATIQKYLTDIRTFLNFLNHVDVLDKSRVLEYKTWLLEHYAVSSVNSMLAALNQFFVFLELDYLKVRRVKVQRSLFLEEERELSKEEYKKLLCTAKEEGNIQLALCMETIASTGIRISELQFFTVERIRKGRIEIYNKGKYRRILLPSIIRKKLLLFARKKKIIHGAVFLAKNGKVKSRNAVWSEIKRLKRTSGVEAKKLFPHNLRHLFARMYYAYTKDLAGLADLLGHSSLNVTRIYTCNTGKRYQKQLDEMMEMKESLT